VINMTAVAAVEAQLRKQQRETGLAMGRLMRDE
jgi:hypothetical protein